MSNKYTGDLPSHWRENKVGGVYKERTTKVSDRDFPPLSVTKKGIVPQLDTVAKTNDNDNRKLVKKNDFVINSRSDRRGSCGISKYEGSVSLINTVLEPINNEKFYNNYYDWLFHTENFADEFYKWGHGIVDDLWTTRWLDMKNIEIPYPPLSEQKAIADFLDNKCAQIDEITKDLEEKLNKLESYKNQTRLEILTRGLDADCEIVETANPIVKTINKNYKLIRLRFLLKQNDGGVWGSEPRNDMTNHLVLRSTEQTIDGKWDIVEPAERNLNQVSNLDYYRVKVDDLLITKSSGSSDHIGKTTIADDYFESHNCYYSNFLQRLRTTENLLPRFLWHILNCNLARYQFVYMQNSTSGIGNINSNDIDNLYIPYPPLTEQKAIADFLDDKCAQIDEITKATREEIETLKQYKQSLIYEYVTGKKEVPNE